MESRLFGSSRRPPRSLAARVLGAQSSSCLSLEGASRRAGALLCGQGPRPRESVQGGRASPSPRIRSAIKHPASAWGGLWHRGFSSSCHCSAGWHDYSASDAPDGPQDAKQRHQDQYFLFLKSLFLKNYLFIYLFMAVLGLRFCAGAFPSCGKWGPLFIAVHGPLTIAASPAVEHRLQTCRLSSCGSRA